MLLLACAADAPRAATVVLEAVRDNTIYAEATTNSNGAGQHLFAGQNADGEIRRGLVAFDLSSLPAAATISSATLEMYCSKAAPGSPAQTIALHRLLADWGEGASDAGLEEGGGAPAEPGDATWISRFFGSLAVWTSPGGDFAFAASGSSLVGAPGFYYTWSTAGMVADVQGWVGNPATNHGWLLRGSETGVKNVRRFGSKDNGFSGFWPRLTVEYTAPVTSAGAVPDGDEVPGKPLTVARDAVGDIVLAWGAACVGSSDDYAVYEGTLGTFATHGPVSCTTEGALSFDPPTPDGDAFWLVVPVAATDDAEGSYGRRSDGAERTASPAACHPQSIDDPVCPR